MRQNSAIKVIIVEDDDIIRNDLIRLSESLDRVEIVASFNDGTTLLQSFNDYSPDAVFLDIKMQNSDGLTIAAVLRELSPEIFLVFVTAHTEYAVTAYQLDAVDYLVKPITKEAVERAVNRILKRKRYKHIYSGPEPILMVKNKHEIYLIHTDEIIYMEKLLRKTRIHTSHSEYETSETLGSLAGKLPDNFFRCHKSFVININKINKIYPIADRTYGVSFHNYGREVIIGRKGFECLCSRINCN